MTTQSFAVLSLPITLTGTVATNRFVTVAGAQAGADANTFAVSRVAGVSGDKITGDVLGTATITSGAAFSKGDTLKSDANGKAITWATSGAKVALALEAATAADQLIEVLLIPNVA
jgi:hypothetical protein